MAGRAVPGAAGDQEHGATAYVSDELVLGVYAEEPGPAIGHPASGTQLERWLKTASYPGRLSDGTTGWVKSAFLTANEPAVVRVKRLEEELDRSRATTPALAEAAARSEVERLKLELAAKQAELDSARGPSAAAVVPAETGALAAFQAAAAPWWPVLAGIGVAIGLGCGFWLGYATLARRIRHKFGGLKVY